MKIMKPKFNSVTPESVIRTVVTKGLTLRYCRVSGFIMAAIRNKAVEERWPEYDYMWNKIASHPVNEGLAEPTTAEHSVTYDAWEYMETLLTNRRFFGLVGGNAIHKFRHRNHPKTNTAIHLKVPASKSFSKALEKIVADNQSPTAAEIIKQEVQDVVALYSIPEFSEVYINDLPNGEVEVSLEYLQMEDELVKSVPYWTSTSESSNLMPELKSALDSHCKWLSLSAV